jgi:hypothetical protein
MIAGCKLDEVLCRFIVWLDQVVLLDCRLDWSEHTVSTRVQAHLHMCEQSADCTPSSNRASSDQSALCLFQTCTRVRMEHILPFSDPARLGSAPVGAVLPSSSFKAG